MRVLVVEDDLQISELICTVLERAGCTVDLVTDGSGALGRIGRPGLDVIVLDRMLPGMSGCELMLRMREAKITTPVLMLSALGQASHRVEGLNQGADDYLGKPFEPDELVARLRALARRASPASRQPVLFHGDIELNLGARTAHRQGRHLGLSPREFDLLRLLVEHGGELVDRQTLLSRVWKLNFDPKTSVVDVNIVRLRRKLEDGFATQCLETIRGRGYRLVAR